MPNPPRDSDGYVIPHDDREKIPDESYVIRYIHQKQFNEGRSGRRTLSSGAFSGSSKARDRYQGMSVDMLDALNSDGIDPLKRLARIPLHEGAVLLKSGDLRNLGLAIGADPMNLQDIYHASVWGVQSSHRKKIKNIIQWLIRPDDVEL